MSTASVRSLALLIATGTIVYEAYSLSKSFISEAGNYLEVFPIAAQFDFRSPLADVSGVW